MAFRPEEENSVYVGQGAELTGAIRARDSVVVDGSVEGEIACGHLTIGPHGSVNGRISVSTAEIAGHVRAEIVAEQLLSVRSTGRVEGQWDCAEIEVERGALLLGSANMIEAGAAAPRRAQGLARAEPLLPAEEEAEEMEEAVEIEEVAAPAAIAAPALKREALRKPRQFPLRAPRRSAG